ncbi:ABC transporter ATP-binding protein [Nocardioides sp. LS1]|uniref:ABC transporter ATP-binding protein n=1 Tax=Nocardioides sp. LS1 TaxID=1027620 RepID=UPI000F617960|nr:ABC transporter ATP-binding protein [Nocardioides sp. LS1]GCD88183.1 hypothetical protein NLS1_01890 [Nocardioides sp. LS1]
MSDSALTLTGLDGWRGKAHVVQELDLDLPSGRLAVVGRNGMGKTTLCEAVTGMLALTTGGRIGGSAKLFGTELVGLKPHQISRLGVGYVPQGRRVFGSLTVEENLKVASRRGDWDIQRVYGLFPRLQERRSVKAANLSGGEQQMLAVGRALVTQPRLLIMDEPSEGLAPVVVDQLVEACHRLSDEGMDLLVVEQNLGAALSLADDVVVISNGRVVARLKSQELRDNAELQRQLLGIGMPVSA